jgi:hypothetical protein
MKIMLQNNQFTLQQLLKNWRAVMSGFGIVAVLALLVATFIILKKRKKCSSCCSKEAPASNPKDQGPEIKSTSKPIVSAEPINVNPPLTDATIVSYADSKPANKPVDTFEPPVISKANETVLCREEIPSSFPQDSIQRRHYLTHLTTMIESLSPSRPTESVLCRHYDTMIVRQIERCLNNKEAMEQVVDAYHTKNR